MSRDYGFWISSELCRVQASEAVVRPVFALDFELMTGDGSHLIDTAKQVRIEHFRSGELTWQHLRTDPIDTGGFTRRADTRIFRQLGH